MAEAEHSIQASFHSKPPPLLFNKQNYAPFISKSPRFSHKDNSQTDLKAKFPKYVVAETIQHQLPASFRQHPSSGNSNHSIFKSKVGRFQEVSQATPSPGQYTVEVSPQGNKKVTNSPQKMHPVLPQVRTIPTIPDHRNKYGYVAEGDGVKAVHKSRKQVELEKDLMHQHQKELVKENRHEKREKTEGSRTPRMSELNRQVRQHLREVQNQSQLKGARRKSTNSRSCLSLKQKMGHLYNFDPERSKKQQFPVLERPVAKLISEADSRFQFFNSSQRRFKTDKREGMDHKAGVREYLEKMIKMKQMSAS